MKIQNKFFFFFFEEKLLFKFYKFTCYHLDEHYVYFQCFTLKGEKHEVTKLARSPDKQHLAVGYNDGKVCVFDLQNGEKTITFSGHKSAVTALQYDHQGLKLVSGGKVVHVNIIVDTKVK